MTSRGGVYGDLHGDGTATRSTLADLKRDPVSGRRAVEYVKCTNPDCPHAGLVRAHNIDRRFARQRERDPMAHCHPVFE